MKSVERKYIPSVLVPTFNFVMLIYAVREVDSCTYIYIYLHVGNKRESGESDENEYTRKLSSFFFFFISYYLNKLFLLSFISSIFYIDRKKCVILND